MSQVRTGGPLDIRMTRPSWVSNKNIHKKNSIRHTRKSISILILVSKSCINSRIDATETAEVEAHINSSTTVCSLLPHTKRREAIKELEMRVGLRFWQSHRTPIPSMSYNAHAPWSKSSWQHLPHVQHHEHCNQLTPYKSPSPDFYFLVDWLT